MNKYITKKLFIIINMFLILTEIVLIYIIINNILTKDLIGPENINILDYLKIKLNVLM